MELMDREVCYRALQSRDPRFDGLLFVAVTSTGIYCRPVCPARTPKLEHCRFFASAAAAQEDGFRPCLRCRPETAPQFASWRGTSNTVSRALSLINDGALDGDNASVDALAERLGVGERQLRRLFLQHLGVSPIAVAQTRRVLFAKQLIHETQMPMTQVALASGFGSIRRFNETFRALYDRPPSALRRITTGHAQVNAGVTLRLRYSPPYDWQAMLAYLAARAIPGVEIVEDGRYLRTIEVNGNAGSIEIAHLPERQSLALTIRHTNVQDFSAIVSRVRRVFDLGADIATINAHLQLDSTLAPLVMKRPGLRAPGAWDGFELGVRAILGQQVSVAAARGLAHQLVKTHGTPMRIESMSDSRLTHSFPSAERIAVARELGLRMPQARISALQEFARHAAQDSALFGPFSTMNEAIERLRSIRGIGEWTAHYVALRALREMDAFPASDIVLLRSFARLTDDENSKPAALLRRSEPWRPWRAYAAQHIWAAAAQERESRSA